MNSVKISKSLTDKTPRAAAADTANNAAAAATYDVIGVEDINIPKQTMKFFCLWVQETLDMSRNCQ